MHARRGTIVFVLLSLIVVPCGRAVAAVTPGASPTAITEVPDGTMLSKDNWQIAQGYLPDEILELYKRGDYANFPWERYRGEPKPRDARPFPLLWEKAPAEDGRMLVALSDGSVELWDEAAVDRALAEAGVGR